MTVPAQPRMLQPSWKLSLAARLLATMMLLVALLARRSRPTGLAPGRAPASMCSPERPLAASGTPRAGVRVAGASRRLLSLRQVPRAEAPIDPGETALAPRCRQTPRRRE